MIPIIPIVVVSSVVAWLFGSAKASAAARPNVAPPPPPSPAATPTAPAAAPNEGGDPRSRPPANLQDVANQAQAQAAAIQAAAKLGPSATPANNRLLAAQELELHLKANRPGTESPAMVSAYQTLAGLKADGKYGPVSALALASDLRRTPPAPRYGTAAALAKYKKDLAKLLGQIPPNPAQPAGTSGVVPPPDPRGQQTRATSEWRYGDPLPGEPASQLYTVPPATPAAPTPEPRKFAPTLL